MELQELIENQDVWFASAEDESFWRSPAQPHSPLESTVPSSVRSSVRLSIPFGIHDIDSALAFNGLARGSVHEFCAVSSSAASSHAVSSSAVLLPPLSILSFLAVQSALTGDLNRYTIWIGRDCWPSPLFLRSLLPDHAADLFFRHSIFIDPREEKRKLWSIESALRSPVVLTVVADIPRISLALGRRFSLAAKSTSSTGFFAISDLRAPAVSATRWEISTVPGSSDNPRFKISLLKQKGKSSLSTNWTCECAEDGEKVSLGIPADVVRKPRAEKSDQTSLRRQA